MISVGLIGCGDVAEQGHLPTILDHPRFRLAAVCDVSRERTVLLSERAGGVPAYLAWRELLASERLDAVVLALPPEVSPDVVVACLERKLAVLDEKPLAVDVDEGRRFAHIVAESAGVYQIGFVLRYGDWVEEVRHLSSSLGSPLRIRVEVFDERFDPDDTIHFGRIQSFLKNSSAMTHEGSHAVDYISRWNNSPWVRVTALAEKTHAAFAGPNAWNAQIDLADGSRVDLYVAWLLSEPPYSRISISGPAGRLDFNCLSGQGTYAVDAEVRALTLPPLRQEWQRQYDAFARAIDDNRATVATVDDGLRALEVTAACELSVRVKSSITRAELVRRDER